MQGQRAQARIVSATLVPFVAEKGRTQELTRGGEGEKEEEELRGKAILRPKCFLADWFVGPM